MRGYTEAERLGDRGVDGSLELRTPQLLAAHARIEQSYVSLFLDAGRVSILEPLPGETSAYSLASTGFGFRFKARGLFIGADGAYILKNGAVTEKGRYRGSIRVTYSY